MGKYTSTGNWKRTLNKDKRKEDPVVLVGFGKHDLKDLIKFIDTDEEERLVAEPFAKGWPPRYRRVSICTKEDIEAFRTFTTFMTNVIAT